MGVSNPTKNGETVWLHIGLFGILARVSGTVSLFCIIGIMFGCGNSPSAIYMLMTFDRPDANCRNFDVYPSLFLVKLSLAIYYLIKVRLYKMILILMTSHSEFSQDKRKLTGS